MKRKLFAVALMAVGLMFAMAGCQKEGCTDSKASNYDPDAKKDNGTCVYTTPEPEPTPVIPTKEITLNWNWKTGIWEQLNKDTIAFYAKQEDVKFVFLNIVNEDNGAASSNFKAKSFHRAVDTLQTRFDISDKVCGSGTIFVNEDFGAQLPDSVPGTRIGMYDKDSAKLAGWGYFIKRCNPFENSK